MFAITELYNQYHNKVFERKSMKNYFYVNFI